MIVVDTNIISYVYLASPYAQQAEQALCKDAHWVAPYLWRSEFRNVLAQYLRHNRLSLTDAQQIMDAALHLMQGREYNIASTHILKLVAQSPCSAYDCEFVALAQDLNAPLVTLDKQIIRQFPEIALSLETFTEP